MPESKLNEALIFRRTKIVATVGPACSDEATIVELINAGVNVFRLNMSHGTHDEHRLRYQRIRTSAARLQKPVAVLADLCGPKIRVGLFEGDGVDLAPGGRVTITTETVLGTKDRFTTQYAELPQDVVPGSRILLDDGNLELLVEGVAGTEVSAVVVNGGHLKDKKGMNLPGVAVSAPALTQKDRADAQFASALGVDWLALSFVRKASDLEELRAMLVAAKSPALIIAKIEKPEAVEAIDAILDASDAVMVARGDLGVELDLARVPNVQEELVDKARDKQKPVIVATQMLESMITASRPTRAEVTDVANAVRSGADAVMLSAETAAGAHPVETVRTMDLIIRQTEAYLFEHGAFGNFDAYTPTAHSAATQLDACTSRRAVRQTDAEEAIAEATSSMSRTLRTNAIVAMSASEGLLRFLSSKRPASIICLPSSSTRLLAVGCLSWGVQPVALPFAESEDPVEVVRSLESLVRFEQVGGFWLFVHSNSGKSAGISVFATP